jgi:hypothetical protein
MTSVETSSVRILSGKCLCGTVRYEVEDRFRYSLNCHCSNCRRTTGSAFKPFAGIERGKLRITAGASPHRPHLCRLQSTLVHNHG